MCTFSVCSVEKKKKMKAERRRGGEKKRTLQKRGTRELRYIKKGGWVGVGGTGREKKVKE